jgi:quinol monooxygenase YgiN
MVDTQVTVIALIKAKKGMEERVDEELRRLLAPTRAEEGCLNFDMHQALEDTSRFMFHENWTTESALRAHFETPHIKHWLTQTDELLAEPLDVSIWKRVG